jgi:hypothetical protein
MFSVREKSCSNFYTVKIERKIIAKEKEMTLDKTQIINALPYL